MLNFVPTLTAVYNKRVFFNVSIVESKFAAKKCFRKGNSCFGEKVGEASVVLCDPSENFLNPANLGLLYMSICSYNNIYLDANSEDIKRNIYLECLTLAEAALGKD